MRNLKKLPKQIGRPTKYTPELLDRARGYLSDFHHHDAQFPSHIGLALYLGISTATLYDWRSQEEKSEFSSILEIITQVQHELLIGNGLSGKFSSGITKLVLGKHGYTDRTEQNTIVNIRYTDMTEEELDRRIAQLENENRVIEHG